MKSFDNHLVFESLLRNKKQDYVYMVLSTQSRSFYCSITFWSYVRPGLSWVINNFGLKDDRYMKNYIRSGDIRQFEEQLQWISESEMLLSGSDELSSLTRATLDQAKFSILHDEELENAAGGLEKHLGNQKNSRNTNSN